MHPVVAQLKQLRIDREWTFDQLSASFKKLGIPVSQRTLYVLIEEKESRTPREITIQRIRRYFTALKQRPGRPRVNSQSHAGAAR